ncbi:MAG: carbon monoxide dehydrogenase subunit G [Rhodobacteraceae bacterium]|nr:carbon monoxide dehydrogenase subunit G [Paracoccaceae bacterium]
MEMTEEIHIPAPRERVFAALNDPGILKAAIPGCESVERVSDTELTAKVVLKIGPVKTRFAGRVVLDPAGAPGRFGLTGEGSGGVAGFARGGAEVTLTEQDGGTLLAYRATADVGGKLAQLGNRLVGGTARKLSAQFFENFAAAVAGAD